MSRFVHVAGDGVVLADDFWSPGAVQDNGGVIVASTIARGISPTGVSGRVTYVGTESLLINATQMTVELKFLTGATVPNNKYLLFKTPSSFADNQFCVILQTYGAGTCLSVYVASSINDVGNIAYSTVVLPPSTEVVDHIVYNGALAAASRIQFYRRGLPTAGAISGTIPASMRAGASPITVFNASGGAANAPTTDFLLRSFRIFDTALSAADVAKAYAQRVNLELAT